MARWIAAVASAAPVLSALKGWSRHVDEAVGRERLSGAEFLRRDERPRREAADTVGHRRERRRHRRHARAGAKAVGARHEGADDPEAAHRRPARTVDADLDRRRAAERPWAPVRQADTVRARGIRREAAGAARLERGVANVEVERERAAGWSVAAAQGQRLREERRRRAERRRLPVDGERERGGGVGGIVVGGEGAQAEDQRAAVEDDAVEVDDDWLCEEVGDRTTDERRLPRALEQARRPRACTPGAVLMHDEPAALRLLVEVAGGRRVARWRPPPVLAVARRDAAASEAVGEALRRLPRRRRREGDRAIPPHVASDLHHVVAEHVGRDRPRAARPREDGRIRAQRAELELRRGGRRAEVDRVAQGDDGAQRDARRPRAAAAAKVFDEFVQDGLAKGRRWIDAGLGPHADAAQRARRRQVELRLEARRVLVPPLLARAAAADAAGALKPRRRDLRIVVARAAGARRPARHLRDVLLLEVLLRRRAVAVRRRRRAVARVQPAVEWAGRG